MSASSLCVATNMLSLIHISCREDILRPAVKKELSGVVLSQVPEETPGTFNQAVMELGETVCLPNTEPKCSLCPIRPFCRGAAEGIARDLPVRAPKKARRIEHRLILVAVTDEQTPRVLLRRRSDKGLLAGLWELPGVVSVSYTHLDVYKRQVPEEIDLVMAQRPPIRRPLLFIRLDTPSAAAGQSRLGFVGSEERSSVDEDSSRASMRQRRKDRGGQAGRITFRLAPVTPCSPVPSRLKS